MGHTMNHRTVRRLTDLEIDEVSLVDRPANQHGLVAFAKAYEEESMGIYDADGDEVFEGELEHGDVVYDDAGNEFVFVEDDGDDTTAELQSGGDYEDEFAEDGELIGKSAGSTFLGLSHRAGAAARGAGNKAGQTARNARRGMRNAPQGKMFGPQTLSEARTAPAGLGAEQYKDAARAGGRNARGWAGRNRSSLYTAGAAGTAGAGVGYSRTSKSLGASVYEELSKALTSDDRDVVISKAMDRVSKAEQHAEYLEGVVSELVENQELEEFTEIAKGYGLPVDPSRLGSILKSAAATMDDEDLRELDRLLMAQGSMYESLGSDLGGQDSEIHSQIEAMALEVVGKADVTFEQGVVATYEANPAAYDEYLAESR